MQNEVTKTRIVLEIKDLKERKDKGEVLEDMLKRSRNHVEKFVKALDPDGDNEGSYQAG